MNFPQFAFDGSLLGAPLCAGLLVVATHVPLGRTVLERGIIFIDLTVAQVAALGVLIAGVLGLGGGYDWSTQAVAVLAALLAAAVLAWTEMRFRPLQEALIGSLYVLSASAAVLVVSHHPNGTEHLQALLAGQILWVGYARVWPVALLYGAVLALWFLGTRYRTAAFYFLFAVTVTASVQLIGVYLVFASLILPALAAHGLPERRGLPLGYALGATGYALGLWLSVPLDLPAGPLVVCTLTALALLTAGTRALTKR